MRQSARIVTDTDIVIGRLIRRYRKAVKMTQPQLAEKAGVTYQQIQKYENATDRVSASRLVAIADALGVPIEMFFEDRTPQDQVGQVRRLSRDIEAISHAMAQMPDDLRRRAIAAVNALAMG